MDGPTAVAATAAGPRDEDKGAAVWKQLRLSLLQSVRGLVRDDFAADDLANDIILSVLRKLANSGANSLKLRWSRRIASLLAARKSRDATRRRLEPCPCLDDLCAPAWDNAVGAVEANDFAECLCAQLGDSDRETLAFLRAGASTNAEIAAWRGVSLRSVEESRCRLRKTAAELGNDARSLRVSGLSGNSSYRGEDGPRR